MADRQAGVFVGLRREGRIDELMTRHRRDRGQHALVAQPFVAQPLDHAPPHVGRIEAESGRRVGNCCGVLDQGLAHRPHLIETQRKLAPALRTAHAELRCASQPCHSGTAAWSVRSTCSGVIDTWPFAVAKKSVPSPASRASPAAPIQYIVSPRGLVWRMTASLAWRRPTRLICRGNLSASAWFGMFTFNKNGERAGLCRNTCSMTSRATRAAASRCVQPFSICENAIDGMPNRKPSIAAATVPEYSVSSPMFAP